MVVGRCLRAGEGGGCGISVRSAQWWLRLRAREATVEATLEEKGRWWSAPGAGEEEGVRCEEGKAAVKVSWKRLDNDRERRERQQRQG
ncbi:hypothetical protein GW17_00053380 [Ensete ventricosum]|nr:hypothetical protein GW17_00053380 [Ensete ventricosum]